LKKQKEIIDTPVFDPVEMLNLSDDEKEKNLKPKKKIVSVKNFEPLE
jgi:predicted glycosyltransferase involved in capsule biosynthesis